MCNYHFTVGSTFHGLHAITTQIAPIICSGIDSLVTDTFQLQCFQTLTGIKFLITCSLDSYDINILLRSIYELYSDYVLKNPFYEIEMPIRCEKFNKNLERLIQRTTLGQAKKPI